MSGRPPSAEHEAALSGSAPGCHEDVLHLVAMYVLLEHAAAHVVTHAPSRIGDVSADRVGVTRPCCRITTVPNRPIGRFACGDGHTAGGGTLAKQERGSLTRRTILLAAASLFDEKGYDGAGIAEIIARAAVTRGALYFHFPSKEALAEAIMLEQAQDLPEPIRDSPLQTVIDLTRHVAHELQSNLLTRAGVRLAVDQGSFRSRAAPLYFTWIDLIERYFREAEAKGQLLPRVCPRGAAEFVVSSFTGVQLISEELTKRTDLERRVEMLWGYLLPGIVDPGVLRELQLAAAG